MYLYCSDNQISNLNLSQNLDLEELDCDNNNINNLNVSFNLNLKRLNCTDNELESINVTQNSILERLDCRNNQIVSIEVSQNQSLEFLLLSSNLISNIDVSQNSNLYFFTCYDNQLVNLNVNNGNNINLALMWAYNNPNLTCIQVDDENANYPVCDQEPPFSGWCIDSWAEYNEECILAIEDKTKINFTLYPNPTQNTLFVEIQDPIETVKIYNLQGQLIDEVSTSSVDVSQLSAGLYFVQVTVDGKSETKKFVKN